ncbi:MAG TPA: 1,4-dihydroxy-2-naphthoate octaprenyltransferase [Firmicutes bacterium]|nr:1,4-dihydroxy-2-naphthoate octaprenyltransferase [Bacillota bacterium]
MTVSVISVLAGTATAAGSSHWRPGVFWPTLFSAMCIHLGTNLINDYFDYINGVDTHEERYREHVLPAGLLTPRQVGAAAVAAFLIAILFGLPLIKVGGWPILTVGLASIATGVLYTGGPWPLGYNGLGDILTFVFFGLVAVSGTFYLHADGLTLLPVLVAVPIGSLVTAILAANNTRDAHIDRQVGKRTLAVMLSPDFTRKEYIALVTGAYLMIPLIVALYPAAAGIFLSWLTLPLGFSLVKGMLAPHPRRETCDRTLAGTFMLHWQFGLLVTIGLLIG